MNDSDCQIKSCAELKVRLHSENRALFDFDTVLPYNSALVFFLDAGVVALAPNNMHDRAKCILFDNREVFNYFLNLDRFPIVNENADVIESFQNEISGIDTIQEKLLAYFQSIGIPSSSSIQQSLVWLQARYQKAKFSDEEKIYAILLLGHLLKTTKPGKWILLKEYGTFNPYYVPTILYDDQSILVLREIVDLYFIRGTISVENFLALPWVSNPKLTLDSEKFHNRYAGYMVRDK